jgi:serine/threonine protein kinase
MSLHAEVTSGIQLDGYDLVRIIGEGGFGKVWLCRASFTGELKAIKIVAGERPAESDQEFKGLVAYKEKALWMRSDALLPVEHANAISGGFFYVMPLADSLFDGVDPLDESWQPKTLAACVQSFKESGQWLNSEQIRYLLIQLIGAAQVLEQAGLVHRDIKPENVLFWGERPVLGDCGLVGPDKIELTRRGTPGYTAPRYYIDSGGSPDMYGLGALLYTLLTGRSPDSSNLSARRAYWWPPGGEASLTENEKSEWSRLRNVILTALDEEKRYVSLEAFAEAVRAEQHPESPSPTQSLQESRTRTRRGFVWALAAGAIVCALAAGFYFYHAESQKAVSPIANSPSASIAVPAVAQISPERMQELDAIAKEAQGKLDAYVQSQGTPDDDFAKAREMLAALGQIDGTAPDADQQLKAFLDKYHRVRLPLPKPKGADDDLNDLYSYVGRIYDWAKTDPEKEIAQIRAMDFNRKLTPLLNSHTEGMADVSEFETEVDAYVHALCFKRTQAARDRDKTLQTQAEIDDENKRASEFYNTLQRWGKWVKRDNSPETGEI